MGSSRQTVERLRHTAVNDNLAHIFASKERVKNVDPDQSPRNIYLTEFGARGDVLSYGKSLRTQEEKLASAWSIYDQMTTVLINFDANNALFPDMKPTNFLLTEDGNTIGGIFNLHEVEKSQYYLYSPGFEPPELQTGGTYITIAEKHHAYLLGFSLFLYLTDQGMEACPRKFNPDFFTFEHPIFQSEKGKLFQLLIHDLVKVNPEERLGLYDAKQRLQEIQYGIKVENSPFKAKTEAYFFLLHYFAELQEKYPHVAVSLAIEQIKILIENHEKNPNVAIGILRDVNAVLSPQMTQKDTENMLKIIHAVEASAYEQTLQEKYENPLARRMESQLQIELLQHPTSAMMASVRKVSQGLINVFEQIEKDPSLQDVLERFAQDLIRGKQPMGFGSQPQDVDYERIKQLLLKNEPENLNQIMFIHFLFAQLYMRSLPPEITAPNPSMPVGKLKQIIEEYDNGKYKDAPEDFFKILDYEKLRLISDQKLYNTPLFHAEPGRGRYEKLADVSNSQMGIMLVGQLEDGLPTDPSSWTPDAKYQKAKLDSIYVRDLVENDAVYVAGPSGMSSLFLSIMEMYGNLPTVEEKQSYLAAINAYMVSGGLHSMHEVIAPAQYALDLVPGYNVSPPDKSKLAAPPNYHQFYQLQMSIDPEFESRYQTAWEKLKEYYAKHQHSYVHMSIEDIDPTSVVHKVSAASHLPKSTSLTTKTAADRFIGVLNIAVSEYCQYVRSYSGVSKDNRGIDRAVLLLEKAREEHTLEGVVGVIQHFLSEETFTALPKFVCENLVAPKLQLIFLLGYVVFQVANLKADKSEHSLFSYLLNALKCDPQLLDFINENITTEEKISIERYVDYTQKDATSLRKKARDLLTKLELNTLSVPESESHKALFQKYKENLRLATAPLKKENEDSKNAPPTPSTK